VGDLNHPEIGKYDEKKGLSVSQLLNSMGQNNIPLSHPAQFCYHSDISDVI